MENTENGIKLLQTKQVYGHTVHIEDIPLNVFTTYPECDTQRDTEGRATKAFRTHLKDESPLHGLVHLAQLPDGSRVVIDACTRSFLWRSGKKTPLESVTAYTVQVADIAEANKFYYHLDNAAAVDRSSDIAFGMLRSQAVKPASELVRKSGYQSGLRKAFGNARKDLVQLAAPLIQLLDSLDLRSRQLPAGVLAGFFATVAQYGENALPFWRDLVEGTGVANEQGRTPALALARRIEVLRAQNKLTGDRNVTKLMEISATLFNIWTEQPDALIPDDLNKYQSRDSILKALKAAVPAAAQYFEKPKAVKPAKERVKRPKITRQKVVEGA